MRYFDTSFLVPLVLPEPTSEPIAGFFHDLSGDRLAVSHWTRVEFASLLARQVRTGGLNADKARDAATQFESMIRHSFASLLPNMEDYDLAKHFLERFETGLRAGDALHLAIAHNHGAEVIYSLDKQMIAAAGVLDLPASTGIPLPGYDEP